MVFFSEFFHRAFFSKSGGYTPLVSCCVRGISISFILLRLSTVSDFVIFYKHNDHYITIYNVRYIVKTKL